jgi:hypothetical protein
MTRTQRLAGQVAHVVEGILRLLCDQLPEEPQAAAHRGLSIGVAYLKAAHRSFRRVDSHAGEEDGHDLGAGD